MLLIDILEHLVDPVQTLQRVRVRLAPGGLVLVNLPNHFDWHSSLRLLSGAGIDAPRCLPDVVSWRYPHLRFFRHQEVRGMLLEAGLEIVTDYSSLQSSLPKCGRYRKLATAITSVRPALFAAGFLMVCAAGTGGAENTGSGRLQTTLPENLAT